MGWFNKKDDEKEGIPSLPELPKLPDFPRIKENIEENQIHQLPSLPNSSFGQKFSQNTIKDAVTGGKESDFVEEASDFKGIDSIPSLRKEINAKQDVNSPFREELDKDENHQEIPYEFKKIAQERQKNEPVFIRIDKFEESLNHFDKIKKQIIEIEKMLSDIKLVKEKEETELDNWERELKTIKTQLEKIDRTIFSKIQ